LHLDGADEFGLLRREDPTHDSVISPFQLSDVCNTTHQFFLRHNRAARKSKLTMQSAPVRRKSGDIECEKNERRLMAMASRLATPSSFR
jgi:hypothetical protein